MFIVQPSSNFGDLICEELDSTKDSQRHWQTFEFAVAWINLPGANSIMPSAKRFLADGGCIRATVGLDFSSTSYEGLSNLLDLENTGNIKTYVFFDENRACTFHPKVFLFNNQKLARLFVGSNNMTGAGLNTNVEVALGVSGDVGNETIDKARETLRGWRDEQTEQRVRHLTLEFLDMLLERGYVRTEEDIRRSRKSEFSSRLSTSHKPLFGKSKTAPTNRSSKINTLELGRGNAKPTDIGDVLLMRVKPRRNGKQIQISMKIFEDSFMNSPDRVVSAADNTRREIGFNFVNRNGQRKRNTARFEAPELEGTSNPIARFIWVDTPEKVLQYEIFDGNDNDEGGKIFESLSQGITTPPVTNLERINSGITVLSKSDRNIAQWYRVINFDDSSIRSN